MKRLQAEQLLAEPLVVPLQVGVQPAVGPQQHDQLEDPFLHLDDPCKDPAEEVYCGNLGILAVLCALSTLSDPARCSCKHCICICSLAVAIFQIVARVLPVYVQSFNPELSQALLHSVQVVAYPVSGGHQ